MGRFVVLCAPFLTFDGRKERKNFANTLDGLRSYLINHERIFTSKIFHLGDAVDLED